MVGLAYEEAACAYANRGSLLRVAGALQARCSTITAESDR